LCAFDCRDLGVLGTDMEALTKIFNERKWKSQPPPGASKDGPREKFVYDAARGDWIAISAYGGKGGAYEDAVVSIMYDLDADEEDEENEKKDK
jgi:hypothetical protein